MSTITRHLPKADEVRCKLISGKRGVRKKVAVFGPWVAVKLDGQTAWTNVERRDISSKEV